MNIDRIISALLLWYNQNKRDLPWRQTRDPYKIWLSEVILQQTRVEQGLPYYLKFIEQYSNIFKLAKAPIDEVLRTWQGLGYYTRARNLHKCAKTIVEQYKGKFPEARSELLKLPGIGPYTSAAIASISFGKKEAVVDGNVIRVITRLFGIEEDISSLKTIKRVTSIAESLITNSNPDIFNQAIMEYGATQCKPNKPLCEECIFMDICISRIKNIQHKIPLKSKKIKKRKRFFNYLVIRFNNRMLMKKRNGNDIWHGLFEFLLLEAESEKDFMELQLPSVLKKFSNYWVLETISPSFKHVLTHQIIDCKFYEIKFSKSITIENYDWFSYEEVEILPKSILIDRYLREKIN